MCVLSSPSRADLLSSPDLPRIPITSLAGTADISNNRISLQGSTFWVTDIVQPGRSGPADRLDDGDLLFGPPSRIFTLHVGGGTVKLTVLAWQAKWAVTTLGFTYRA
ncbi:hypothetical protein K8W59_00050 [Nocardioides rotundus]|uniref:hypothetical protein n=1 Tax=Nocardioides rotundus TaxID=1774216 RepID=UPI001CC10996|nr:hypothetical protein [Nocardioides rotundus]UAL29997.1 hypothetical protein K8W59_00050 [Nocardioides rotundus]